MEGKRVSVKLGLILEILGILTIVGAIAVFVGRHHFLTANLIVGAISLITGYALLNWTGQGRLPNVLVGIFFCTIIIAYIGLIAFTPFIYNLPGGSLIGSNEAFVQGASNYLQIQGLTGARLDLAISAVVRQSKFVGWGELIGFLVGGSGIIAKTLKSQVLKQAEL